MKGYYIRMEKDMYVKNRKLSAKIWNNISDRKNGYIEMLIIAVIIIAYSSVYFNNTFPYSEGWFVNYVELVKKGLFPYKDFYYYLPPLNLFIDYIFWELSFGYLIVFRAWYVLERILIYLLVFRLLSRFFKKEYVTFACCLSSILCTADDFDFFGDYNQNVVLVSVILAFLAVRFIEQTKEKEKTKTLFIAGIVLGIMLLIKQTIFIACLIVFFLLLIYFCIVEHDKSFVKYVIATALGVLIPILICGVILLCNGALVPCIEQLFLYVDGKGTIIDIIFFNFLKTLHNWKIWRLAIGILIIRYVNIKWKFNVNGACILIVFIDFIISIVDKELIDILLEVLERYTILSTALIATLVGVALVFVFCKKFYSHALLIGVLLLDTIVVFLLVLISPNAYHFTYELGIYKKLSTYFGTTFFYVLMIIFVGLLIATSRKIQIIEHQNEIIMIAGSGLALNYATSMAAGLEAMASNSMRISLPFVLTIIFSYNKSNNIVNRSMKYVIAFVSVIVCLSCIGQKSITAYPWWGCKDSAREEKIYKVDNIHALKGIYFSKEDKEMYENITALISENSDEDDIILGYPYIKIYNILCNRYNSYFVPVFWFDVVGDKYVNILIDEINERLPEIVVWYDIMGALEVHEAVYRNGKPLEQRKIVEMFNKLLEEQYECLGKYNGVCVYKLEK